MEESISHLVVWTRFKLDVDGEKGKLTVIMREKVEKYVDGIFRKKVGRDKVRPHHFLVSFAIAASLPLGEPVRSFCEIG